MPGIICRLHTQTASAHASLPKLKPVTHHDAPRMSGGAFSFDEFDRARAAIIGHGERAKMQFVDVYLSQRIAARARARIYLRIGKSGCSWRFRRF